GRKRYAGWLRPLSASGPQRRAEGILIGHADQMVGYDLLQSRQAVLVRRLNFYGKAVGRCGQRAQAALAEIDPALIVRAIDSKFMAPMLAQSGKVAATVLRLYGCARAEHGFLLGAEDGIGQPWRASSPGAFAGTAYAAGPDEDDKRCETARLLQIMGL